MSTLSIKKKPKGPALTLPLPEYFPQYFMCRVTGTRKFPPRKKHLSVDKAEAEAERLARLTGRTVTILTSYQRISVKDDVILKEDVRPDGTIWKD